MYALAPDIQVLPLSSGHRMNAYLIGEVLVDAGLRHSSSGILRALKGRAVSAHAITHAHADHVGGTRAVARALDVPVWIGDEDADALERGRPVSQGPLKGLIERVTSWAPVDVARRLVEGDPLGETGFVTLATPGHTAGHSCFWRETDRTLIVGDVLFSMDVITGRPGIREPFDISTIDKPSNREQVRRVASLRPALALFGHGPPLRDPDAIERFASALPA